MSIIQVEDVSMRFNLAQEKTEKHDAQADCRRYVPHDRLSHRQR